MRNNITIKVMLFMNENENLFYPLYFSIHVTLLDNRKTTV